MKLLKTAGELTDELAKVPRETVLSSWEDQSGGYRLSAGVELNFVNAPPEGAMTEVPTVTIRIIPDGMDTWENDPPPPKEHDAGRSRVRSGNYHGA